jgi:hypothetical protein
MSKKDLEMVEDGPSSDPQSVNEKTPDVKKKRKMKMMVNALKRKKKPEEKVSMPGMITGKQ